MTSKINIFLFVVAGRSAIDASMILRNMTQEALLTESYSDGFAGHTQRLQNITEKRREKKRMSLDHQRGKASMVRSLNIEHYLNSLIKVSGLSRDFPYTILILPRRTVINHFLNLKTTTLLNNANKT